MSNEISLPELMPPQSDREMHVFRRRRGNAKMNARVLLAVLAVCAAVCALFIFAASRSQMPAPQSPGEPALSSPETTDIPPVTDKETLSVPPESLPVLLPIESSEVSEQTELPEKTETEPQSDSVQTTFSMPEGAFSIKEILPPTQQQRIINRTSHSFNLEQLDVLASAVISPAGPGASVLVISTHTSECFLPTGALYYHPDEHPTHTDDPNENMTAVAGAFCEVLRSYGIETVHVTYPCDISGSGKAYINARNEIARAIAENPNIKYVLDIERATYTDSSGALLRTSVILGKKSYAPIQLTVSGGGSLGYARICQNLSLALQLNDQICEQSSSLIRPVQIADAVYTDGNSPRSLKIEIGGYTSTLDEAVSSARLLAELFALLLNS